MIRCITFDLDDTLWPVEPVIQRANQRMYVWLEQHAPEFKQHYPPDQLAALQAKVLQRDPAIAYSVTRIRMAQLQYGLSQAGYAQAQVLQLSQQAFEVFYQARQEVEFFPHALEVLTQLKVQGYQLGALSNGNADIQQVGLAGLMDFQFKADRVGTMKPHPKMFQDMLQHCSLKPAQVIHVGDNPEHDIAGAAQVGLRTLWVNLNHQPSNTLADKEVKCLSQIPEAVKDMQQNLKVE